MLVFFVEELGGSACSAKVPRLPDSAASACRAHGAAAAADHAEDVAGPAAALAALRHGGR